MADPNLYSSSEARFNTVVGQHDYYKLLRRIREEFDSLPTLDSYAYEFDEEQFIKYVKENYGILCMFDNTYQAITSDFNIIDEQKYLIARLKFA